EPLHALGRWDEAESLLTQALALDPPVRHRTFLLLWRSEIALSRGQINAAADHLQDMRALVRTQYAEVQMQLPMVRVDAAVALARGDPDRALEELLAAVDAYPQASVARYLWPVLGLGATACAELA